MFCRCLAAAEMGFGELCLYEPVRASLFWSLGLDLRTSTLRGEARLASGRSISLPVYIRELVTALLEMCQDGSISEEVAPRAGELLPRVLELTHFLEEGSLAEAAVNLDWAAKLLVLVDRCEREDLDLDDLQVETTDLSEIDVAKLREGDIAIVTFDALTDLVLEGTVTSIAPKAAPGSGVNYPVIIELSDIPPQLRWGMTAFIDIEQAGDN